MLLPEPCSVNAAATRDEGYRSLTWGGLDGMRKGGKKKPISNPYSNVWLNVQKSAEAVVP